MRISDWSSDVCSSDLSEAEAEKIVRDARAVDAAGCFLLVIEGVMEEIADKVTEAVSCPTIGIGASARCDGQVLVAEDMLGMFERVPRFVKRYEAVADTISAAAAQYEADVRSRAFPTEAQVYRPKTRFSLALSVSTEHGSASCRERGC